jgi:hypothetical protein
VAQAAAHRRLADPGGRYRGDGGWAYLLLGRTPAWLPWLRTVVLLSGLLAAAAVLAMPATARLAATGWGRAALAAVPVTLALTAALAGPAAYSITTAATAHTGALPAAGPAVAGAFGGGPGGQGGAGPGRGQLPGGARAPGGPAGFPGGASGTGSAPARSTGGGSAGAGFPQADGAGGVPGGGGGTGSARAGGPGGLGGNTQVATALTRLLMRGAAGHRWAAATVGAESAAPLQLAIGEPVMAIGGFNGTDDAPTLAGFEHMVAAGEIHYFVGANQASFGGGSGLAAQITTWVRVHFTAETVGGVTVYDLTKAR